MKSLIHKRNPSALGELQQNQQDQHMSRLSPRKAAAAQADPITQAMSEYYSNQNQQVAHPAKEPRGRSPTKSTFSTLSLRTMANGRGKSREPSPTKAKKPKSGTNLGGLLPRPKSFKNLYKLAAENEVVGRGKDKENRTPVEASVSAVDLPTPIYAQFSTDGRPSSMEDPRLGSERGAQAQAQAQAGQSGKQRPRSFHPQSMTGDRAADYFHGPKVSPSKPNAVERPKGVSSWERSPSKTHHSNMMAFESPGHHRSKSYDAGAVGSEAYIDPNNIDTHLEAMLDRRNIPENQRYKMRNLNATIKMEFIRQDWAEMQAAKTERPKTNESGASIGAGMGVSIGASSAIAAGSDHDGREAKTKRSRGKSFTLGRGSKKGKDSESPTKKSKGEGTLGRHFRTRSSDSIGSDRPPSASSSGSTGILSKIKFGHGPGDFVSYLRKVQKPEVVEVGKLHKLRLLLRNETVTWTEDFIQQGGMQEIVGLLNRIMMVEWREEHEDALLHETLLCLKALCTTALALQYLHSIQESLFPKLLHMLFDPEKKGPSEFTTRNIVTSVLFTYIGSAAPHERISRAATVLSHLRDPEPKEEDRPVPFVLEMRRERPYKVWCKEAVSVTKEVFWIFLHHLNVVSLDKEKAAANTMAMASLSGDEEVLSYMSRHFPQERPPVPAAPYVGGVEWDATNYLASHLDLMNAILACTPTMARRNALRNLLRISGWERCLGGSLRLCKEKFYGSVHEGLRTWVAAAAEDGWDVRDVRYGPPAEAPKSPAKGSPKKKVEAAPKIDMPKLDLGIGAGRNEVAGVGAGVGAGAGAGTGAGRRGEEAWLS